MAAVVAGADDVESGGAPRSPNGGESKLNPATAPGAQANESSLPKGSPRFVNQDKTLADGEEPFSEEDEPHVGDARLAAANNEDERDTYADIDPEVYRRLRPAGKAIARILDEAMYPEPEEEPVYYWDEEYEGDPEELTTAQIAFITRTGQDTAR